MRVPGTRRRWTLAENPAYAGREPTPVEAVCHDGTPFITIQCPRCGADLHMHESQLARLPEEVTTISLGCPTCRGRADAPARMLTEAFADMRRTGWIE